MFPIRVWQMLLFLNLHFFVFFVSGLEPISTLNSDLTKFQSVHVGVVLDMHSVVGSMADICLSMALDDFYDLHDDYKTRVVLHKRHSDNVVSAASTVIGLLEEREVVAIIGPQSSIEATFVIEVGRQVQVPVITFSVTSPSISHAKNPYFIRASQNDSYQVQALTELIRGFSWSEIVLIYEDTVYGNGIIPYLMDALQKANIKITYKCAFLKEASGSQITEELNKMRGLQTQVFLVHMMTTSLGSQLFERANDVGLMSQGYAWIITDGLSNSLDDLVPIVIDSMDGVLGIRPYIPKSIHQGNFKTRWKKQFRSTKPDSLVSELNIFGLWAYDTIWAIAKAVEDTWPLHNPLYSLKSPNNGSNPIRNLGISLEGPRLLNNILNVKTVQGLSGEFNIVNGQLEPLALEIFNVIGNGERVIGFWTPKNGISRISRRWPKRPSPSSVDNLRKIIWPGDSTVKPIGSGIPHTLKKLKIGVTNNVGFRGLVELNQTTITYTGYCMDVFRAAVEVLPHSVKFEYELLFYPFNSSSSNSTHDELLFQVHNKTLDAVVGDTSITAGRWYVDFTLPYSDSGVVMVVPSSLKAKNTKIQSELFIFLKPFTFALWVAFIVAYVLTLFAIACIRRMQNENDQNQWHFIWTPIAAISGHGENKLDNRTHSLVLVWFFGTSLMMGSYTAAFNSIISAQRRNGKVDLYAKDVYIGYQLGSSIVKDLLLKKLNIDESRIKGYSTMDQYDDALSKGSLRGGVSAVFDETPYVKLFLARSGSKYRLDGPTYKNEGFGFAFPMGSPLVSHLSKAIINITNSGKIEEIEHKYFGTKDYLENPNSTEYKFEIWDFLGLIIAKLVLMGLIVISEPGAPTTVKNKLLSINIWDRIIQFKGQCWTQQKKVQPIADPVGDTGSSSAPSLNQLPTSTPDIQNNPESLTLDMK